MKSGLKRIFGETACGSNEFEVKQEVFYNRYGHWKNKKGSFKDNSKQKDQIQKGTNPLDRQGRRTKCAICSSVFHWVKDCPHKDVKYVEEDQEDECNLVMFTNETQIFMTEAFGTAILDTVCTRTVYGAKWLFDYVETLNEEEKDNIVEQRSERIFRFGDGSKVKALKNVVIPAVIGDKQCTISTDVVDLELPLLLSKESLKKANAILNLNDDEAILFGQKVKLEQTSSGHYCINLRSQSISRQVIDNPSALVVLEEMSSKDKSVAVKKLHRQFGHASEQKLKDLLKKANVKDKEIYDLLNKAITECELCIRFQRTPSRPVVSLPMASDWNELISVDLHQLEQSIWYLHIIDIFTRFSAGAIVRTKDASVVGDKIIKNWMCIWTS